MSREYKIDIERARELLDELYELTRIEHKGIPLNKKQNERYVEIYEELTEDGIEIPFGVDV